MVKQMADTCVATSHQVGLLLRLQDEQFYQWVLAEEKRCVVQADRNSGALKLKEPLFWNIGLDDFKVPQYFDCCPLYLLKHFMDNGKIIEDLFFSEKIQYNFEHYVKLRKIFYKDSYEELSNICAGFENEKSGITDILYALLWMKLSFKEKRLVDKFKYLNKSSEILKKYLEHRLVKNSLAEIYFNYFLGLIFYCLNHLEQAELFFSSCNNLLSTFFSETCSRGDRNFLIEKNIIKDTKKILFYHSKEALGFLAIEQKKYVCARMSFESAAKTEGTVRLYSSEALFGLGVIKYLEGKNNSNQNFLISSLNIFSEIREMESPIFYKAQEYMESIQVELQLIQSNESNKINSTHITSLYDSKNIQTDITQITEEEEENTQDTLQLSDDHKNLKRKISAVGQQDAQNKRYVIKKSKIADGNNKEENQVNLIEQQATSIEPRNEDNKDSWGFSLSNITGYFW